MLFHALKRVIKEKFTPAELSEKSAVLPALRKLLVKEKHLGVEKFTLCARHQFNLETPTVR